MKKSLILLNSLIILIVLSMFVYAAPPIRTITQPVTPSLYIEIPVFEYLKYNVSNKLHFHIYNASGQICTNSTTKCNIHIYNTTNHILETTLDGDSNGYEFYKVIPSSIVNRYGLYSVIIDCNKSNSEFGYSEFGFEIADFTAKNYPLTNGEDSLNFLIFIPLVLAIMFILLAFTFKNEPFKWFFRILSLIMILPTYIIADVILNKNSYFYGLQAIFNMSVYFWLLFGVFALFLIILIVNILNFIGEKKHNELEDGEFKE